VTSLSRYFCLLALTAACLTTAASADLKITTRTTVMGHSNESTVYIKGARERREMSFGGHAASVTITQCDQKRMVTISGNQCSVIPMGGGAETSCPVPNPRGMAHENANAEPPRKGGVVTITRNVTDTGERQDMFGYKARHIKTSMVMDSSPDACNQSHMKMETDGWYADLSAEFSCADESYRAMACGGPGARAGCNDRIVMKGSGSAALGYPLKQTTVMTMDKGTFTTTTEVIEVTTATLEAPLFDAPPGCRTTDMSAMMGGAPATSQAEPTHAPATAPAPAPTPEPKLAPAPAATVAPKATGVVRIGVVKLKDASNEGLPTDNLRLDLLDEMAHRQLEAVPLTAEALPQDVEAEATSKQCDYILYTTVSHVKSPGNDNVPPASLPKGVTLDPAKFQALSLVTLYKVGKPTPELKDAPIAADAEQFGVNAVMATFPLESAKVAQQLDDDAHPKAPAKATKPPVKKPAPKPN
jgi:hypothetical protein